MKLNIAIISGLLLVFFLGQGSIHAQNVEAFKLQAKTAGTFLTAREDGANTLAVLSEKTRTNTLSQQFYFKRIPGDPGKVWIASLKDPNLLLKRTGTTLEFAAYDSDSASDYNWSIDYAGHPFCIISLPGDGQSALQVQTGGSLQIASGISGLDNNTADAFRFRLTRGYNVF